MPSTSKNIALFIDGTWNESRSGFKTNVRKLFEATKSRVDGIDQVKFYVPGVGRAPVMDMPGRHGVDAAYLRTVYFWRELGALRALRRPMLGGMGHGTESRIQAMYHVLCQEYDYRRRDDRVFLFGFSRGAFAACSLAGFLEYVGVLMREHISLVPRAFELYVLSQDPAKSELRAFLHKLTGRAYAGPDGPFALPVHLLGVWDVVGALGLSSRSEAFRKRFAGFHRVELPPNVMHARHGLALHELRPDFEPTLWQNPGTHRSLEQVWFPGSHADVGGGYAQSRSAYSDTALAWMAAQARDKDLQLDWGHAWLNPPPHKHGLHHESKGWFYRLAPQPRSWLTADEDRRPDVCHFHVSARDHLLDPARRSYAFRPAVNAALNQVDALAATALLGSRLSGRRLVE